MHHEPLAFLEPALQIRAVKKARVQRGRIIAHRHVKHSCAPTSEAHRASPAAGHFGKNCVHLSGNDLRDGRESDSVFVAEGQIAEQIADGQDAALLERRGALRANAPQILHRIVQCDRHAIEDRRPAAKRGYLPSTENASSTLPGALP